MSIEIHQADSDPGFHVTGKTIHRNLKPSSGWHCVVLHCYCPTNLHVNYMMADPLDIQLCIDTQRSKYQSWYMQFPSQPLGSRFKPPGAKRWRECALVLHQSIGASPRCLSTSNPPRNLNHMLSPYEKMPSGVYQDPPIHTTDSNSNCLTPRKDLAQMPF